MAANFADDGAAGAGSNLGQNSGQPGFGSGATSAGISAPPTPAPPTPTGFAGAQALDSAPSNQPALQPGDPGALTQDQATALEAEDRNQPLPSQLVGMSFAQGGAIPDDGDTSDTADSNGSPGQDAVSKALDSVDQVLAYGRKLHGLGGDQESGGAIPDAPQQMASNMRMPSVPGNQSNSGAPPIQPQPGPLPPTSNPFGKRTADASQPDSDGDNDGDTGGAINTEETA